MPRKSDLGTGLTDTWGRDNRKLKDRQCPICGSTFRPARASSRFCCRACARKINGGQNRKQESWWMNGKGYIEGRVWIEGKQVRVKQHRWVMEQHLGRPLASNEDVHHRDGDKQNNSIENLELVTHGDHSRITNSDRTYRRGYRLDLSDDDRRARSRRAKDAGLSELGRAAIAKAEGR